MELDKTILQKICYNEHNSGSEHPVPVKLLNYEIIINSIDWTVKCTWSAVNGTHRCFTFVNNLQYKREKTILIREEKLKELGI